jgi:hypothetical protein
MLEHQTRAGAGGSSKTNIRSARARKRRREEARNGRKGHVCPTYVKNRSASLDWRHPRFSRTQSAPSKRTRRIAALSIGGALAALRCEASTASSIAERASSIAGCILDWRSSAGRALDWEERENIGGRPPGLAAPRSCPAPPGTVSATALGVKVDAICGDDVHGPASGATPHRQRSCWRWCGLADHRLRATQFVVLVWCGVLWRRPLCVLRQSLRHRLRKNFTRRSQNSCGCLASRHRGLHLLSLRCRGPHQSRGIRVR